jgi:hypothetical protein
MAVPSGSFDVVQFVFGQMPARPLEHGQLIEEEEEYSLFDDLVHTPNAIQLPETEPREQIECAVPKRKTSVSRTRHRRGPCAA